MKISVKRYARHSRLAVLLALAAFSSGTWAFTTGAWGIPTPNTPMGSSGTGDAGGGGVGYVGLPNSGVVHFFGRVRDHACTATVSTPASTFIPIDPYGPGTGAFGLTNTAATSYVILPDRTVSDFPSVGSVSGWTQFFMYFADCQVPRDLVGKFFAWPYFFAGHANKSTGRLNNIPGIGQAVGIDLQLTDEAKTPFKVYQGATPFGNQGPVLAAIPAATGIPVIPYGVEYYRSAGITPGAVRSNVDYIVYFK